jgi:nucleoside-diphosphate-sugar epimerase
MTEFYKMADNGRVYLFGRGEYQSNPIHGDDLAKVCIDAIANIEKEVLVGGPEVFTQVELANVAFDAVGSTIETMDLCIFRTPIRTTTLWSIRSDGRRFGRLRGTPIQWRNCHLLALS